MKYSVYRSAVQCPTLTSERGFTFIELIVVISILSVMAIAGLVSYQQIVHGLSLDRAQNVIVDALKAERLSIANGASSCSRANFITGDSFFVLRSYRSQNCLLYNSLVRDVSLDSSNIATLLFQQKHQAFTLHIVDAQGNVVLEDILASQDIFAFDASRSLSYIFKNSLDDAVLRLHYLSPDNLDPEKLTHIVIQSIEAIDTDLQPADTEELIISLEAPDARAKLHSKTTRLKLATLKLEKLHTSVDPIGVLLSSIFDNEAVDSQSTRLFFEEELDE